MVLVRDPATGRERELATNKASVREAFAAAAAARQETLATELRNARIDHLVLSTDRAWLDDLLAFITARRQRIHGAGAQGGVGRVAVGL